MDALTEPTRYGKVAGIGEKPGSGVVIAATLEPSPLAVKLEFACPVRATLAKAMWPVCLGLNNRWIVNIGNA